MHFFPPSELVVKHLPALLNLAVHSGLWEKECCCAVPARSLPSSDSRFLTALSHGRNRASSTWDFAQKCSLALTVRRPPRSWPPTSLPSAHTRFTLPNHQMWDVSQHRKETGKMAGILSPSVLSLLLSTQMSRDLYTDKNQGFLSLRNVSSHVAYNYLL